MERSGFIMATKKRVLSALQDMSLVFRIEILFFRLAVGADLPLCYSMAISCLKKFTFQICLCRGGILFLFSSLFFAQRRRQTD